MNLYWLRERDKYGRSTHRLVVTGDPTRAHQRGTIGVVVRLPRTWSDTHGTKYLSNDWTAYDRGDTANNVNYHYTLAEGKARLEAIALKGATA